MDFYQIKERSTKNGVVEIYPDFKVCRSKDLMVRGKSFYAIWDENRQMWSRDEYDVQRLVDDDLMRHRESVISRTDGSVQVKLMSDFSSKSWSEFRSYMMHISDNAHELDEKLTFADTETKKTDYISKRLSYPLKGESYEHYDELVGTLYEPDERAKLEWAIGAIISGDAKNIQKFIVLYGEGGTGKSTILNIIQKLFDGYYTTFEAKALTSSSNAFSTEAFKTNPLVAIQHDGDLSKIEDNTKLNSIVSHEEMTINEKYKPSYMSKTNCFLFIGTNKPVKITDAKSGIIRRLIDVRPTGQKVSPKRYHTLMTQIDFELGAIAKHCLDVYHEMGKNYYSSYRPLEMMLQTDVFFNFVEANYYLFKEQDSISLVQAYDIYKQYCDEALVDFKLPRHKFREELKNYFDCFSDITRVEGKQMRSYYSGFQSEKFTSSKGSEKKEEKPTSLVLDYTESIFDEMFANCPAQYASSEETPIEKWEKVKTILANIKTKKIHYVMLPENLIVIDFDIKDSNGNKSLELNLEAASKWPATYTELSKSGSGVHLHYYYDGDVSRLSRIYDEGIEVKVFTGNSSLRRKLTKCNNIPILTINSGLPLKGEKMINFDVVKSEKNLRALIKKNLNKEIHPGTKPSIDFIHKILEDSYNSGLRYDITDMRPKILAFANNSSHQADYCIKLVNQMKFKSEENSISNESYENDELSFFDVEVFPNLFVVVWKFKGKACVKMINPKPADIEPLLRMKLVGFNCRRYDNHMIYARYIGYTLEQLYNLSQRVINESRNALFGEAYNLSYTDVYDFASAGNKKSLKKFEIELGIHHQELGLPWDQPVPEELWDTVADYCCNDVIATEAVFDHLSGDWTARKILAELSGLTVNDTTNQHSMKIIFGKNKNPQSEFQYRDLAEPVRTLSNECFDFVRDITGQPTGFTSRDGFCSVLPFFPGYKFENGKSIYRGEEVGEGGYVYSEPGMYGNVALLDVASMHPTSTENEILFGPKYTKNFSDIKKARIAIKHQDAKALDILLDGKLVPFVSAVMNGETTDFTLTDLSNALKTVINSVYGLTSAKFDNPFRDTRNIDNIVAKRGALFMVDLKHAVQEKGFTVAHIKTDSIKIPDATQDIIDFVMDFGRMYGYTFEHEATYEKMCLVNDAVYIAKYKDGKHAGEWTATGAQFAHPYVFKTLFSHEKIEFRDMAETKTVSTALYLDMNENLGENEHDYHFVGKAGSFCPIKPGCGGGMLMREKEGKYYAATGSTGYRWMEEEVVQMLNKEKDIDQNYHVALVDAAISNISKFGDFEQFASDEPYFKVEKKELPPWSLVPCGDMKYETCFDCPNYNSEVDPAICKLGYDMLPF